MITRIAKQDELWDVLSLSTVSTSKKGKRSNSKDLDVEESSDDRLERLMYTLKISIKPNLLVVLTDY